MITTTNMSLTAWDQTSDYFNHTELANNWTLVDEHDHGPGKGVQIDSDGIKTNAIEPTHIAAGAVGTAELAGQVIDHGKISGGAVRHDNIFTLPGARVYNNAAISIPDSTSTPLTFNTEIYDGPSGFTLHDTGSNTGRLTAPTDGVYLISGHIEWASNSTGTRTLSIAINGSNVASIKNTAISGEVHRQSISTLWRMSLSDYATLVVYQNSTGSLNVNSTGSLSPQFAAQWVSA